MIILENQTLVGRGLHREVYVHPENDRLCVKVAIVSEHKEFDREYRYYRLLQKRRIHWDNLPRFHGMVATDRGAGAVFDLIRDADGQVSKTLGEYLVASDLTATQARAIVAATDALKRYLLDQAIITMTLKPKNIVYQHLSEDSGKLFVIDNIGNSDFIPLCNYVAGLARRKIARKWRQFENTIASLPSLSPELRALVTAD